MPGCPAEKLSRTLDGYRATASGKLRRPIADGGSKLRQELRQRNANRGFARSDEQRMRARQRDFDGKPARLGGIAHVNVMIKTEFLDWAPVIVRDLRKLLGRSDPGRANEHGRHAATVGKRAADVLQRHFGEPIAILRPAGMLFVNGQVVGKMLVLPGAWRPAE